MGKKRSDRVKFNEQGEMRVKGDKHDTSRTGGTDIKTKGLRYTKPGGQTRRPPRELVEWGCPDCAHTNERWRVQCVKCGWNRRTRRPRD